MDTNIKYADLLKKNAELFQPDKPCFRIAVLSNITISTIKDLLEYSLRSRGVNAMVEIGDYDNIVQDCGKFSDYDAIFVFYELANIVDALPFQLHCLTENTIQSVIEKAKDTIRFIFDGLAEARLVVFNLLSAFPFSITSLSETPLDRICTEVNSFVRSCAPRSFNLVDVEKIFAQRSVREMIDLRFFLSSRALYSVNFLRAYSEHVYPLLGSALGKYKKVLVLDCDNTLWKGVLGEEGAAGVQIYREIQSYIVTLARHGILVCLCSKNNPEDVDEILKDPRMILKEDHIVCKAVNWNDKCENLALISQTLNLGMDSLVFLDDSDFEINLVRQKVPDVTAIKVPSDYVEYIWLFQYVMELFYMARTTEGDFNKTLQYKSEFSRTSERSKFDNIEDYLATLNLEIMLFVGRGEKVSRLAELTRKTNQFNLTTRRMTEAELDLAGDSSNYIVMGLDVRDKFGEYGTTGLLLIRIEGSEAVLEQFLLSCRVIGRRIEFKIFDYVVEFLKRRGVQVVFGKFIPTSKNAQVRELYSVLGFDLIGEHEGRLDFRLDLENYRQSGIEYIEVKYA